MTPQLDQVAASLYIQELHEQLDACLFHLEALEKPQADWQRHVGDAERTIGSERAPGDSGRFNEARKLQARTQTEIFDGIEAFLAAWARLSLLFSPAPRRSAPHREFTALRGVILRDLFELDDAHPVLGRGLRDSWMHADERLDSAWLERRLGNRQQFVSTAGVERAVSQCPRVIGRAPSTVRRAQCDLLRNRDRPARGCILRVGPAVVRLGAGSGVDHQRQW